MMSRAKKTSITAHDFTKLYTEGSQQLVVLDVRTPQELEVRHLPDTDSTKVTHINTDDFFNRKTADASIRQVIDLGSREVYCLCKAGVRSGYVAQLLRENGVDAVNIEGGIYAIQIERSM